MSLQNAAWRGHREYTQELTYEQWEQQQRPTGAQSINIGAYKWRRYAKNLFYTCALIALVYILFLAVVFI